MLTNFFKNVFSHIRLRIVEKDPISIGYHRLNYLNSKNKLDHLEMFSDELLYNCLNMAIRDNNLSLIKNLYPYMKKNINELKHDNHESHLFTYATLAMTEDKLDIFDYFITTYIENNFRQKFCARFSDWEFSNLIELMIKDKKIHYFNILRHHGIFCCHDYLADYLSGDSYHIRDNTKQLEFMLENFKVEPHHPEWYKFLEPKSIDINELLISASKAEKLEKNVIEILLDKGADTKYKNGLALCRIINKIDMDIFNLLIKNNIPINIRKIPIENPIYFYVQQWDKSKKLSGILESELAIKADTIKTKINKI